MAGRLDTVILAGTLRKIADASHLLPPTGQNPRRSRARPQRASLPLMHRGDLVSKSCIKNLAMGLASIKSVHAASLLQSTSILCIFTK
jgi:hypothetical protein